MKKAGGCPSGVFEASQCNTAVSLVPIIRGENPMLVGDPQQLNPVILLDELTNHQLRRKYQVTDEYDYRKNSIYKTFLTCDSVSDGGTTLGLCGCAGGCGN